MPHILISIKRFKQYSPVVYALFLLQPLGARSADMPQFILLDEAFSFSCERVGKKRPFKRSLKVRISLTIKGGLAKAVLYFLVQRGFVNDQMKEMREIPPRLP